MKLKSNSVAKICNKLFKKNFIIILKQLHIEILPFVLSQRGEINNFQYLIALNTLAGRSYNDLMQYPVFPWIVADYDSPELDFSQPSTFRDLSMPMGAQTPDRLKQFQKRYNEWDDPQG